MTHSTLEYYSAHDYHKLNDEFHQYKQQSIAKLEQCKTALGKILVKAEKDRVAAWKKTEALENEIDGLNVDKLYLKERLRKFESDAEKRREQKRAGMRRFRAKKKEAKG